MAEDMGDKTEAPTPKRRSEAHDQGNIARSQDLTASVVILGLMMMLKWYGEGLVKALKSLMEEVLSGRVLGDTNIDGLFALFTRMILVAARAMAPLFIGAIIIAVLINLIQVGLFFNTQRIQPNFAALNPTKGLSRIFGGGAGFVQLLMNAGKMTLVALTAYSAIHGRMAQIITVQQLTFIQIFGLGAQIVYSIITRITILAADPGHRRLFLSATQNRKVAEDDQAGSERRNEVDGRRSQDQKPPPTDRDPDGDAAV